MKHSMAHSMEPSMEPSIEHSMEHSMERRLHVADLRRVLLRQRRHLGLVPPLQLTARVLALPQRVLRVGVLLHQLPLELPPHLVELHVLAQQLLLEVALHRHLRPPSPDSLLWINDAGYRSYL